MVFVVVMMMSTVFLTLPISVSVIVLITVMSGTHPSHVAPAIGSAIPTKGAVYDNNAWATSGEGPHRHCSGSG